MRFYEASAWLNFVKKTRNILYCFAFFRVSPNRLLSQNCFAPLVESIFDEFLWGEEQESADFSSRVTQKGAEIDRQEARGFESLMANDCSTERETL